MNTKLKSTSPVKATGTRQPTPASTPARQRSYVALHQTLLASDREWLKRTHKLENDE